MLSIFSSSKETIFKTLYFEYYAPLCVYAHRIIEDEDTCRDVVSDLFLNLWERKDAEELSSPTIAGYMKTAVRNSCLNLIKHQSYVNEHAEEMKKTTEEAINDNGSLQTLTQLYQQLYDVLEKVPEDQRKAFLASTFEGKTYDEIAAELNVSSKTVSRYKQKVLELLKDELHDYLPLLLILISSGKM